MNYKISFQFLNEYNTILRGVRVCRYSTSYPIKTTVFCDIFVLWHDYQLFEFSIFCIHRSLWMYLLMCSCSFCPSLCIIAKTLHMSDNIAISFGYHNISQFSLEVSKWQYPIQWPLIQDSSGEPVPEENTSLTHFLCLWVFLNTFNWSLLFVTFHSILLVYFLGITVFLSITYAVCTT